MIAENNDKKIKKLWRDTPILYLYQEDSYTFWKSTLIITGNVFFRRFFLSIYLRVCMFEPEHTYICAYTHAYEIHTIPEL